MKNRDFITSPKRGGGKKKLKNNELVTIILLSENHGYRMKAYGPISLINLAGKCLLERQITAIKATFINFEIIVCAGFESQKVVDFVNRKFSNINIRIVENQIHYNSNCCESARLCLNNTMNDKILICGGGVLIMPYHLSLLDFGRPLIVTQKQVDNSNFEVGIVKNKTFLENLSVGVKGEYWTELLYLHNEEVIDSFKSIISNPDYKNKFLFEAINPLSKRHKITIKNNNKRPCVKIDNIKTLRRILK